MATTPLPADALARMDALHGKLSKFYRCITSPKRRTWLSQPEVVLARAKLNDVIALLEPLPRPASLLGFYKPQDVPSFRSDVDWRDHLDSVLAGIVGAEGFNALGETAWLIQCHRLWAVVVEMFEQLMPWTERLVVSPDVVKRFGQEFETLGAMIGSPDPHSKPAATDGDKPPRIRSKRSTASGDAQTKLTAALLSHHRYDDEDKGPNYEPIGNNDLSRLADVSPSTASAFFRARFEGYAAYSILCRRNQQRLWTVLRGLNGDFTVLDTYGSDPG